MSSAARATAISYGAYPERAEPRTGWLDRQAARLGGHAIRWGLVRKARDMRFVDRVTMLGREVGELEDEQIREEAHLLGKELRVEGFAEGLVARAFALVREAATRTIGERHYEVQLLGGRVLLEGIVAEMETGEGKTLTATLAASTAALAGVPVHVVTVNDYLAARDASWMGPVYRTLGLTVGLITHGMTPEARRAAYACDVTYCTNKELTFDYLRDRLALGGRPTRLHLQLEQLGATEARARRVVLRGLHYAIVDEADSVLVDEARTPLIISGRHADAPERQVYETALDLAGRLESGRDFVVDQRERSVQITDAGRAHLDDLASGLDGIWTGHRRREEFVRQALTAIHLYTRDVHYLVREDKVQIVDEYTGRVMADRSWERGLHQLIETKEHCAVTGRQQTLARISYQRFFRRYLKLAGMTGTAREVAGELWAVYRLATVSIPTNRPLHRTAAPGRFFLTQEAKWNAIVERIVSHHRQGRPVLVGTRSVAASEHLSALLTQAEIPHRVLNARQDKEEADIVAKAGEAGQVTVATNMAGRGTDIRLGPGVDRLGGLQVIATERHEAGRIDRQLFGRCGRQGDPGSYQAMVSLQDEIVKVHGGIFRRLTVGVAMVMRGVPRWAGRVAFFWAQRGSQRLYSRARRDLLEHDEQLDRMLAFSGLVE